jgi:hypothetical protein
MIRLYLDLCCFKRPFDDQRQERIRREATAVTTIIERAEHGQLELVRSPALLLENDRNPREDRRLGAALWIDGAAASVVLTDSVEARARALAVLGFPAMDALHVAFAEAADARWLVTCDDQLLALGRRCATDLRVAVVGPVDLPVDEGSFT